MQLILVFKSNAIDAGFLHERVEQNRDSGRLRAGSPLGWALVARFRARAVDAPSSHLALKSALVPLCELRLYAL